MPVAIGPYFVAEVISRGVLKVSGLILCLIDKGKIVQVMSWQIALRAQCTTQDWPDLVL